MYDYDEEDRIYIRKERYMCDVLEDMRNCVKHMNFSNLAFLIEEAQSLANRMEAGLENRKTYYQICKTLRGKLAELNKRLPDGDKESK